MTHARNECIIRARSRIAVQLERAQIRSVFLFLITVNAAILGLRYGVTRSLIAGDSAEYFMGIRSLVIDRDLDFAAEFQHFYDERSPHTGNRKVQSVPPPDPLTGRVSNRRPIGTALAWLPFYGLAHLATLAADAMAFTRAPRPDGYGGLYQVVVGAGSLFYGFFGVLLLYAIGRRSFSRSSAFVAAITLWFATPLVYYMTVEPLMAHATSAFFVSLFLWFWLLARERTSLLPWAAVGAVGGMLALVRHQEAVFLLLPAYELTRVGKRALPGLLVAATTAIVTFAPQFYVNTLLYGSPLRTTYSFHVVPMGILPGRLFDNLFGFHYGLFTTAPVTALGVAGLYALTRRNEHQLAAPLLALVVVQLLLISSFWSVFQGASFGNRLLLNLSPGFGIGLMYWLERAKENPKTHAIWLWACLGCAALNGVRAALYCLRIVADPAVMP
jgi:dolichyl-phosphate-mannose-protein mannosyltransferase